ncbi:tryptophan-rich sensory protein [Ornithinimicrobium sp. Arc0846-15]|nr:tryptophan-rich sensory protein [Ornithinimicrobium laminariae]
MPSSPTNDRTRQIVVTASEVFCLVGTLVGVGVLGTSVEDTADGALAADATLLAPAGTAFSIWSVIYIGLFAYTIWQWLPSQTTREVHRRIGYLAAVSMILNASWLLVTQQGWIWVSVLVILALAVNLGLLLRKMTVRPSRELTDKIIIDATFGLYLGWVAVASVANITTALIVSGLDPHPFLANIFAVAVLIVVVGLGVLFNERLGGRWAVAAAMAWGLGWISVGRLTDEPHSIVTGLAAALAALAILGLTWQARRSR